MNSKVVVAFATDHNFRYYTGVAVFTLIEHASRDTQYEILILSESLPEADRSIFYRLLDGRSNFTLRILDMKEKMAEVDIRHLQFDTFPAAVLYRLFLHELLPEYDKVLYLDSDIIVQADIKELFETDLGAFPIGAVKDEIISGFPWSVSKLKTFFYLKKTVKLKHPTEYFNSGVLLADLRKLRHSDFSRKVRGEIAVGIPYKYPDQDILNRIFDGKIRYFQKTWNYMVAAKKKAEQQKILHYASIHPWFSIQKPHAELWWHTAEKTSFANEMKKNLACHPGRIKYLENIESAYYALPRTTYWRITAWIPCLFNMVKWVKLLCLSILK